MPHYFTVVFNHPDYRLSLQRSLDFLELPTPLTIISPVGKNAIQEPKRSFLIALSKPSDFHFHFASFHVALVTKLAVKNSGRSPKKGYVISHNRN
jgi:hypothetical protein